MREAHETLLKTICEELNRSEEPLTVAYLQQKLKWRRDKVESGLRWAVNQGYAVVGEAITITPKAWDWWGEECMS